MMDIYTTPREYALIVKVKELELKVRRLQYEQGQFPEPVVYDKLDVMVLPERPEYLTLPKSAEITASRNEFGAIHVAVLGTGPSHSVAVDYYVSGTHFKDVDPVQLVSASHRSFIMILADRIGKGEI